MTPADSSPDQKDDPDLLSDLQVNADLLAAYFEGDPIKPQFEPIGVTPRYKPPNVQIDPDTEKSWLRRVLPIFRHHKVLVIGSLSLATISTLVQVVLPAIMASAIDNALLAKTRPLMLYVLLLAGLGIGRGFLTYLYRYGMSRITFQLEYNLRMIIYEHLTKLSFSFFDKIQSGQVISRANSDIRSVQMFLTFAPFMALNVITFGIALVYMLNAHVLLTLVAVFALPGVHALGKRMRQTMFPLSWLVMSRSADLATVVDENVNGVRVIKSFAAEMSQIKLLAKTAQKLRWAALQMVKLQATFNPIMSNIPRIGLALVILYGGYLAIEGQVTIGTLLAFSTYVMMLAGPFRMLGFFLMAHERAKASAGRIYEILDQQSEIVESPDATDLTDPKGAVEFRNVTFAYGEGPTVLKDFNLEIEPGQAVAIVGRTGSGKSTIIRLLTRFYDTDEGAVCIDGIDSRELTLLSLRSHIGIVLDEPFLFSTSLRDNIAYGRPGASMAEVQGAAKAASAHDFIEELPEGYDTVIGERWYTLSGGQRQRIAIARTLLINPRILVLDDATSAVDVQVETVIHNALESLMRERTTIVIAHRLSTIMLADKVALVEDGKVVAFDTHTALMDSEPRYVEVLAHVEKEIKKKKEKKEMKPGQKAPHKAMAHGPGSRSIPPGMDRFTGGN